MTVPLSAAAKRLCERSGGSLSSLEPRKLLYIAHRFHFGRASEPFVTGYFGAWSYGPMDPALYHRVKTFGASPVGKLFRRRHGARLGAAAPPGRATVGRAARNRGLSPVWRARSDRAVTAVTSDPPRRSDIQGHRPVSGSKQGAIIMNGNQDPVVADRPAALTEEQLDTPRGGTALAPAPRSLGSPAGYAEVWLHTAASE